MQGDLTGYELKHLMERSVGFFFGASYGSIYPALKDLEEACLVRSTRVVQSERPNKKVYAITQEGVAYFRGALDEPPAPDTLDRKSTRLNSSHANISYAVFCLKKKQLLIMTSTLSLLSSLLILFLFPSVTGPLHPFSLEICPFLPPFTAVFRLPCASFP